MIKSQDVLALLKLIAIDHNHWTYRDLSYSLGISDSQLHSAVKRLDTAKLVMKRDGVFIPNISNSKEFLIHAVKFVFPAEKGEVTRGMPTGRSAPPLSEFIVSPKNDLPLVWPDPEGDARGVGFAPIHKYAVKAARLDKKLYEYLTLLDAIREGNARERKYAINELDAKLKTYNWSQENAFKY